MIRLYKETDLSELLRVIEVNAKRIPERVGELSSAFGQVTSVSYKAQKVVLILGLVLKELQSHCVDEFPVTLHSL